MSDSRDRRTSALLALLDAEAAAEPDTASRAVPALRRELAALRAIRGDLRALPNPTPDPRSWAGIQQRLAAGAPAGRDRARPARRYASLALAAGLLASVTLGIFSLGRSSGGSEPVTAAPRDLPADRELAALYLRSRQLESLWQGGRTLRSDAEERALLYRIADLDTQLASEDAVTDRVARRAERERLWAQRVAVLESLAEVRRTRAVLHPAVMVY